MTEKVEVTKDSVIGDVIKSVPGAEDGQTSGVAGEKRVDMKIRFQQRLPSHRGFRIKI